MEVYAHILPDMQKTRQPNLVPCCMDEYEFSRKISEMTPRHPWEDNCLGGVWRESKALRDGNVLLSRRVEFDTIQAFGNREHVKE